MIAGVTMNEGELAAEAQTRAGQRHARGTDSLRVSIVLPAYNEEANIEKAIGALSNTGKCRTMKR